MMRRVWTVARREIGGYFDQPTAYVLIVAFLGLSLFLAFRSMYTSNIATLRPIFDLFPLLFAVFVPAVTMRSLAEERRGKTLEWLMSQPLTEGEIVLGKFLGNWIFVLIAVAGTIPTAVGILWVSEADAGIVLAQYIGTGLLAAQFVALGLWASSVTRNQITAFIVGAAVGLGLFLIGLPVVQIGLSPQTSGLLARLSVLGHFENVARGVIDLRDVIYFASTAGLFLMLAIGSIGKDRLSREREEFRRLRLGAVVLAALVIVMNLVGSYLRGRIDLTAQNLYTLSDGTRDLVSELDDLVQIKLFASNELPPEIQLQLRDVNDLLSDMQRASNGNLLVERINPDDDEESASSAGDFGIFPIEFNVVRDDEFEVRRGYYGLVILYADQQEVMPVIRRTDDLEFRLASAIHGMTNTERRGIAFVSGFGAKPSAQLPGIQQALADRYRLTSTDLSATSPPLNRDSTEVLVVAGPTQPLDSTAVQRVRDFVDQGGAALLLLEPVQLSPQSPTAIPFRSGLEGFVAERGVEWVSDMVIDLTSSERVNAGQQGLFNVIVPYPLWPILPPAAEHPITTGLNSITVAWAGGLEIMDSTAVTALWQTTEAGARHPAGAPILPDQEWDLPEAELGVQTVAVAISSTEGDPRGRMVVVGDATFTEVQYIQASPSNLTFLANALDWLAQDEALIRIRSKDRTPPNLVFASDVGRSLLKWGNLLGMPLLFVLVAVFRVTGRRRRAEARWKGVIG